MLYVHVHLPQAERRDFLLGSLLLSRGVTREKGSSVGAHMHGLNEEGKGEEG